MKYTPVPTNFIYPDITPEHFRFGSNQIIGTVLREDSDWRDYLPPEELQNINGIESAACYVESPQHSIATIQEEQFGLIDQNYSARFNALLSNGTVYGGSPLEAAASIRHDGLVKDSSMPFSDDLESWHDFHSFKGVDEASVRAEGLMWLREWSPSYDIVFDINEPLEMKAMKIREALKYSPVCMSGACWYQDESGIYIKPEGVRDNHLFVCVYVDADGYYYAWDTYKPFLKKLHPLFNPEFAMRWTLEKTPVRLTAWSKFMKWFLTQKWIIRILRRSK
jgi:hypothetical protein